MSDYPDGLTVRPLTTWPGDLTSPADRRVSPFAATLGTTLSALDRELAAIQARNPVMEVAIDPGQFRIDGRPRARAAAIHPGVVLSLPMTSVGPLRYATDRFLTWQDNLRAIVLGMEALRKVERYGITRRGEQYAGFRALPPGGDTGPMTPEQARNFLHVHGAGHTTVEAQYRAAAKNLHPDKGGNTEDFQRLQRAMGVLRET